MTSTIIRDEFPSFVCGVKGRFGTVHRWTLNAFTYKGPRNPYPGSESKFSTSLFMHQTFTTERRPANGYGKGATIRAKLRLDDNCRNGRNDFSMTADIFDRDGLDIGGGAAHDAIAEAFPELAHLVRWHLVGTDGPMHYVANAVYLAGDRDHRGKRAGEPYAFADAVRFHAPDGSAFPICKRLKPGLADWLKARQADDGFSRLLPASVHYTGKHHDFSPKYTFAHGDGQFGEKWHECPFETPSEASELLEALQEWRPEFFQIPTLFSEGKKRDLAAARSVAVWPEATDEELSVDPEALRAVLVARLPKLVDEFRNDMNNAGFYLDANELTAAEAGGDA